MSTRVLAVSALVVASAAASSEAAVYTTRARVLGGSGMVFADQQGTNSAGVAWTEPPPFANRAGTAGCSSNAINLIGMATGESTWGVVNCAAQSAITADDIVFTQLSGSPSPTVAIGLEFDASFLFALHGTPPSFSYPFNSALMQWTFRISSANGTIAEETFREVNNLDGHFGDTIAPVSRIVNVPVGVAISVGIFMHVEVMADGYPPEFGGGTAAEAYGFLDFGTPIGGLAGDLRQAFTLPDGFTANSAQLGIVDNVFASVPTPGALAAFALAGLASGRRRR